jgi:hypothetical protein
MICRVEADPHADWGDGDGGAMAAAEKNAVG